MLPGVGQGLALLPTLLLPQLLHGMLVQRHFSGGKEGRIVRLEKETTESFHSVLEMWLRGILHAQDTECDAHLLTGDEGMRRGRSRDCGGDRL